MAGVTSGDGRTRPPPVDCEIVELVREWAGGEAEALTRYRDQPIPALGGKTAKSLVECGRASAVRSYLDHVAKGGFA